MIATALRLPSFFDFASLLKIDGIQKLNDHPLLLLLKICISGGLQELQAWEGANGETLAKFGAFVISSVKIIPASCLFVFWLNYALFVLDFVDVDRELVERKIRYLALASLTTKYIGRDLPYSDIASSLRIDTKEVEAWVIDGSFFPSSTIIFSLNANL